MAGSLNKVMLIGNLGRDPEVRALPDGSEVVQLSLATSDVWRDKASGERRERTEWHRVVIFNENLGRIAKNYLRKGSKVYVEGQLQTRKWTDQSGQDRYTTEIVLGRFRGELVLLDSRADAGGGTALGGQPAPAMGAGEASGGAADFAGSSLSEDLDDEIPF